MPTDFAVPTYFLTETLSYVTLGGAGYLAWRVVRAYERRRVAPERLRALAERVRRLEDAVVRVEGSVQQVAEANRLTASFLAARGALRGGDPRE